MRIAVTILALLMAAPVAADPIFTTFDVPHSTGTHAVAINTAGVIAGTYYAKTCKSCGFIRGTDGSLTTFGIRNALIDVYGIDDQGTVVGTYDNDNGLHGFMRTADGNITKINLRGGDTRVSAINANGVMAGDFTPKGDSRGFLRMPDGSTTTFKTSLRGSNTETIGINASGMVVGDANGTKKKLAFIRAADGTVTLFQAPAAGTTGTFASSINDAGDTAGSFLDTSFLWHGFVRDADSTMHVFDVPDVQEFGTVQVTCIATVGADRQVIGFAEGNALHNFGFIRHDDGTAETFDLSQGGVEYAGTVVLGCSPAGTIVGFYSDDLKKPHAFIRTP